MKKIAIFILLISITASTVVAAAENASLGKKPLRPLAYDLKLKDLSGKIVKLSDHKGRIIFLNFFATWCPPCRAEMPSMEKLSKAMDEKEFKMIAVSMDRGDPSSLSRFIEKGGYTFLILHDIDGTVADHYGIYSIPTTFIIDKKGGIVQKIIGSRPWDTKEVIDLFKRLAKE